MEEGEGKENVGIRGGGGGAGEEVKEVKQEKRDERGGEGKWRGRRSAKKDAAAGRKKEDSVRRVKLERRRGRGKGEEEDGREGGNSSVSSGAG